MTPLLSIAFPFPVSVNNAYANVQGQGRILVARARRWQREADDLFLTQKRGLTPFQGPYSLLVVLDENRRLNKNGSFKKIDCGNFEKLIHDRLVEWGLVQDDSYADSVHVMWGEAEGATAHLFTSPLVAAGYILDSAEKRKVA